MGASSSVRRAQRPGVRGYGRDNVQTRGGRPAANVKVYGHWRSVSLPLELGRYSDGGVTWQDSKTDPRFTVEWVEENTSDVEMGEWFEVACTVGWEQVEELALEIFGRYGVRRRDVRQDGRSGGWCVVEGLSDVESWDAVMLGRWRRFEVGCRAIADDVPRTMLDLIYFNAFEHWLDTENDTEACAVGDDW